uniref:Uncharacterized protein n=1 Tax=Nelumbo nucifera TaxID=4432 RepID=A0A822ZS65_NELNU|nr:TPA_asm: hypothetical protein HUJ06_017267 [Nelumbo nucifera]
MTHQENDRGYGHYHLINLYTRAIGREVQSNLLRLTMFSGYQLHSWFTYSMLLLFLSTAGFWVFDAIRTTMFILGMISVLIGISLLAPDEPKVFLLKIPIVFPAGSCTKLSIESNSWFFPLGGEVKDSSLVSSMDSSIVTDMDRMVKLPCEETEIRDIRSFGKFSCVLQEIELQPKLTIEQQINV